jgi:hypothetical protein
VSSAVILGLTWSTYDRQDPIIASDLDGQLVVHPRDVINPPPNPWDGLAMCSMPLNGGIAVPVVCGTGLTYPTSSAASGTVMTISGGGGSGNVMRVHSLL